MPGPQALGENNTWKFFFFLKEEKGSLASIIEMGLDLIKGGTPAPSGSLCVSPGEGYYCKS